MYRDDYYDAYQVQLREAMSMDEDATNAYEAGKYKKAADLYEQASVLYAKAANTLLDMSENASAKDLSDIAKSVDRLVALSWELKECAQKIRKKKLGKPESAVNGSDEDDVRFEHAENVPEVSFEDIAGLDEAKQLVLDEVINPLLYKDLYQRFLIENNGGLMLFGPPGSGKTMMARAIAHEAGLPFFSVRCSDIVGKYFGEAEKHVRALFKAARAQKNAVIFLDEAEALACRRGGNSTVMNRLVPELLSQMDGFEKDDGHLIVIFATNRPYDIDPAFLRPGRLPNHCYISLPDAQVRRAFLKKMIDQRPSKGEIDIEKLVERTERFSCADLDNLIKRGCQKPVNRSIDRRVKGEEQVEEYLTQEDLEKALETLSPSVEQAEIDRLTKWMKKVGKAVPDVA